jgi:hypothetical protein
MKAINKPQQPPPSNLKVIASALGLDSQNPSSGAPPTEPMNPKPVPGDLKRSTLTKEASWTEIAARMNALNRSNSATAPPSKAIPDNAMKRRSTEDLSPPRRPTSEEGERFYDCASDLDESEPPSKRSPAKDDKTAKHVLARLQGNPRLRYWDSADHNMLERMHLTN